MRGAWVFRLDSLDYRERFHTGNERGCECARVCKRAYIRVCVCVCVRGCMSENTAEGMCSEKRGCIQSCEGCKP